MLSADVGAIVGGVIGGLIGAVLLILLVLLLVYFFVIRPRKGQSLTNMMTNKPTTAELSEVWWTYTFH